MTAIRDLCLKAACPDTTTLRTFNAALKQPQGVRSFSLRMNVRLGVTADRTAGSLVPEWEWEWECWNEASPCNTDGGAGDILQP